MIASVSIIDEAHGRRVRMGNLAFVGSHKVNGVSALHSDLMKETVFKDLNTLFPNRITNKTNGITPRRWLLTANPGLTSLIRETIGDAYLDNAEKLVALEPSPATPGSRSASRRSSTPTRRALPSSSSRASACASTRRRCSTCRSSASTSTSASSSTSWRPSRSTMPSAPSPTANWAPRVKVFAGKAAASYTSAKYVIKLINDVARAVNSDPAVRDLLKVVFLPNYNVSLAEIIIPAADLSEQISTAGMEASGTGNMKFALNGALTIGTLDGANVEMREHAGADNIFIFGLTATEVEERRRKGLNPRENIAANPLLEEVLDAVASGVFSPSDPERHRGTVEALRSTDWFMVTADFAAYAEAQREVDALWRKPALWREKAILNVARMGWFSSDRTIREYADEIWGVPTVKAL